MNYGNVRMQEANRNLQRFKSHVVEATTEKPRVILLKVWLAVQPRGAHHNEIYVVSHELRKLMAVMVAEGRAESSWKLVNRLLIHPGLGVS